MPDRDDMAGPDPMDEAYIRAEQVLDDEAARAARRAKVLAAVSEAGTPPAPTVKRPLRRYGGWLAAACVAGLSVVTAEQVYRLAPRDQPGAPPVVQPPPPAVAKAPEPPSAPPAAVTAPLQEAAPPPRLALRQAAPSVQAAPAAPEADITPPPPPLPIPPVQKPLAPVAMPPAFAEAKPRAAEVDVQAKAQDSVVVTATRQSLATATPLARAAPQALSAPGISEPSDARMRAEAARLRAGAARLSYDAVVGRTDDIEAALAQGVPVDSADVGGETALMKSIKAGQTEAAALLRRHGASLDVKNSAGLSARDMAAAKHDPKLDQALGIIPSGAAPP